MLKVLVKAGISRVNGGIIIGSSRNIILAKNLTPHIESLQVNKPICNEYTHIDEENGYSNTYKFNYVTNLFELVDRYKMTCCALARIQDQYENLCGHDMKRVRQTRLGIIGSRYFVKL